MLESFTVKSYTLVPDTLRRVDWLNMAAPTIHLTQIYIGFNEGFDTGMQVVLMSLPLPIPTVTVDFQRVRHRQVRAFLDQLEDMGSQCLNEVHLTSSSGPILDSTISLMTNVRKLTIDPSMVRDLSGALAPLSQLSELNFITHRAYHWTGTDLAFLLPRIPSLRKLSMSSFQWRGW